MSISLMECPFRVVRLFRHEKVYGSESMLREKAEELVRFSNNPCYAVPVSTSSKTALDILKSSVIANFYDAYGMFKPSDDTIVDLGSILSRKFAHAKAREFEKLNPGAASIALPVDISPEIASQVLKDIFRGRKGKEISTLKFNKGFNKVV